jgi:hypothetical protein
MLPFLRIAVCAAVAAAIPLTSSAADQNALAKDELADGWILLFDGETLYGWQPTSEANWKAEDGVISVSQGAPGFLYTSSQFGDYVLRVDFRHAAQTNSGVFLHAPPQPTDPKTDCYELNIAAAAVSPFSTGSFVGRKKCEKEFSADEWHTLEVTMRSGRCAVNVDGEDALDYTDKKPLGRGHISLQFNKGAVEFRNIKLKPLLLESIFNGKDLTGWTVFPGERSVFSVTPKGELNVKNGRGQLESQGQYGDFTLQLEVFVNGKSLNSGVFFRSIPGQFWNGYESQIQNGFKEGDRTKPVDCGTGGFYRRQNARKVVSDDFTWFHKTLVVSGNHMATWVNGYQVSDFTDTRPDNENPRNGLRVQKGTLLIQGHDPTTDLSFRNIRVAEMARRSQ